MKPTANKKGSRHDFTIALKKGATANTCGACGKAVSKVGQHDCKYVCEKCGHQPCPFCGDWCDVVVDGKLCCNGKCKLVLKKAKK